MPKYSQLAEVIMNTPPSGRPTTVIHMEAQAISRDYLSLSKRTLEEQLYNELEQDYGFPPAICRSLDELFFKYLKLYLGVDVGDGQLVYRAIPNDVPPGVRTEDVKTLAVRLTIYSPEDLVFASQNIKELTRERIDRITNQAFDQGGVLTQADLSVLLGESPRTIGRRIKELEDEGIVVPTRGKRMDIGPGTSHKTKIIEMHLTGYDFLDIKRRTRHSSGSISRYLNDFARIMVLHERGHSPQELRIITGHSDRLVREYLALYDNFNVKENQENLDQLRARYGIEKKDPMEEESPPPPENGGLTG